MHGLYYDAVLRNCKICNKQFETRAPKKITCSEACRDINKKSSTLKWQRLHKDSIKANRKTYYKRVPYKTCKACGKIINEHGNKKYHEDCVFLMWYKARRGTKEKERFASMIANYGYCKDDRNKKLLEILNHENKGKSSSESDKTRI